MLKLLKVLVLLAFYSCTQSAEKTEPGTCSFFICGNRTCEFTSENAPQESSHSRFENIDASSLGLTNQVTDSTWPLVDQCWAFAPGPLFASRSGVRWAYGGWWDGERWLAWVGSLPMGLATGAPLIGENLFRVSFRSPLIGTGQYPYSSTSGSLVSYTDPLPPNKILPDFSRLPTAPAGSMRSLQMPPGVPAVGAHRLLFAGGELIVQVRSRGEPNPIIYIDEEAGFDAKLLGEAPDDSTVTNVQVSFVVDSSINTPSGWQPALGIPLRPVTEVVSWPLFIELIGSSPNIPKPNWRFVTAGETVSLPAETAWMIRGPCLSPYFVPAPHGSATEVRLSTNPFILFPDKEQWRELKIIYLSDTGTYAHWMPGSDNYSYPEPGTTVIPDSLADQNEVAAISPLMWIHLRGKAMIWHGCDVGLEIEGAEIRSDFDIHAGGYITPPLGFQYDKQLHWFAPLGISSVR